MQLLMARHWRATHEYAAICLAATGSGASIVTAAAFHRLLGNSSRGALRPYLLMTVRNTVMEWAADESVSAVLPELRKPTGGRGLRAARSVTPERRRLAEHAFRSLPESSQCLLWHTEVEQDPISVPARLLGIDTATASAALEWAREQFRTACVRAHRAHAPTPGCRSHNRLLDLPIRRTGIEPPEIQRHLTRCRYCRYAAEQLGHFDEAPGGGLGELLAETVLGWGARRYLESRPGRIAARTASASVPVRLGAGPVPHAEEWPALSSAGRARGVVGVGLTSLALLATVLVGNGGFGEGGAPDPHVTWSAQGTGTEVSAAGAAADRRPDERGRGRLVNLGTGLCLDVRGRAPRAGAPTVLAGCSAAGSQRWSYQDDGLLRSAADPALCARPTAGEGAVLLADCPVDDGRAGYDLTVRGELLPRDGGGRALAPGEDRTVTTADRDLSTDQSWHFDAGTAEQRRESDAGPDSAPVDGDPYATRVSEAGAGTGSAPEPAADPVERTGALAEPVVTQLSWPGPALPGDTAASG
ncbi:RICIN domain-containing protein [Streptomyces sp. NPDC000983]|uniref:RICIN domain-containing protein n=1 Tax=Streptomyces sp. NPDC000983 TaxID=3154373 RepID=UPI0033257C70